MYTSKRSAELLREQQPNEEEWESDSEKADHQLSEQNDGYGGENVSIGEKRQVGSIADP